MKRFALLPVLLAVLLAAGCAPKAVSPRAKPRTRPASPEWPSLEQRADGRLRVVGTLREARIEGGFWVVDVDTPRRVGISGLHVVTLFANATERDAVRKGDYVAVEGTLATGISYRMYGPEMEVRAIRRVAEPAFILDPPGTGRWSAALPTVTAGETRVSGYVVETRFSPKGSYALLASQPTYVAGASPTAVVRTPAGAVFELAKLQGIWVTAGGAPNQVVPEGLSSEWRKVPIVLVESIALDMPPQEGPVPQ